MFHLKVNNITIDLGADGPFAIPFFLNNPLFNDIQSHSLDFNIPPSDHNKMALNFPDDPHFVITNHKVPASLCLYNEVIAEGALTIEATSETGISAFLTFGQGNFAEQAGNTNMKDINWGSVSLGSDTQDVINYILDIVAKSTDDLDVNGIPVCFNFPMCLAPEFYSDKNEAFSAINLWDFGAETPWQNIIASDGKDNLNAIVPFFYLNWILRKLAAHFMLKCSGPFFADAKFNNILILNNFDLAKKIKKYFVRASNDTAQKLELLPSVSNAIQTNDDSSYPNEDNDGVWGLSPSRYICKNRGIHRFKFKGFVYHDYDNNATIRIGVMNITVGGAWLHYLEYEIPVGETLLIEYETSVYLDDSNVDDLFEIVSSSAYFYGSSYFYWIMENMYIVVSNDSYINLNQFETSVNPANHMPEMSANDFINNICKYLGLAPFVNDFNNELFICPVNSIYLDSDVIDITSLISGPPAVEKLFKNKVVFAANHDSKSISLYNYLGEFNTFNDLIDPSAGNLIAIIKTTGVWYISYFDETDLITKWKKYDDDFEPMAIGNDDDELLEFKPDARPVPMENNGTVTILPASLMNATSPAFDTGLNDFDIEITQYHGLQEGPYSGKQYPCASSLRYNPAGTDVSSYDLTPQWIYQNHYKQHFSQLSKANRILNYPCFLSYYDIRNFKPWKKHRIGNIIGLVIGIEGQFHADRPGPCQIKILPL